ncbi:MAG: hypothetical protein LJE60_10390 [Thiocapsa sp.]|jgi:hypothetical protein|nr:hypothetical protein [Thiocapsa sp.]MCG6897499.1 hypothetical protein [Thiocapsa sp.]
MNQRQNFALSLAILGLIVAVAAPYLPGGVRLVANQPPGAGHVTELIAAADGDILVGTEAPGRSTNTARPGCPAGTGSR